MKNTKKSGFTLVELAIVLVIIGLIIGGVLVGQDLIKAAAIKSAVSDIEKFNAAATTFQGKYAGLPGDLSSSKAVEFGFSAAGHANAAGTAGLRDGNSIIEGGAAGATDLAGETALAWRDLGQAGLVGGNYAGIVAGAVPAVSATAATINTFVPRSKLRDSASYHLYSNAGRNVFFLASYVTNATGVVTTGDAVTALEAKSIDEKLDDGAPLTGITLAMTALTTLDAAVAPLATVCVSNTVATGIYNVAAGGTSAASATVCQLQIRTSF